MKTTRLNIQRWTLLGMMVLLVACSKSDSQALTEKLNISAFPAAAKIEHCGDVARDGGMMWDCIVAINPEDLPVLLAGHTYRQLSTTAPERVYLAQPKGFKQADWIHVFYNEDTRKAAIATHAP